MLAVAAFALAGAASTALVAWALIWPLWAALWRVSWSPAAANGCERRGAVQRLLVAYATEGCRRACETGTRRAIEPRSGRRFWSQRLEPLAKRSSCLCEVGYGWRDRDTPDRPLNVAVSAV